MKAVNLLPGDAPVIAANAGKPNLGMIGGAAAGLLAIVVVAAYFGMARVDSVKSETKAEQDKAAKATSDTAAVRSQISSLGTPVADSDKQLAQGAEQVLVSAYTERHDFPRLARELRAIMGENGWYVSIKASSAPGDPSGGESTSAITVVGYLPTEELVASFNDRANSQSTMKNAKIMGLKQERLLNVKTKKPGLYVKFTMTADIVDTVAPSSDASSSATSGGDGTTVSGGSQTPTLSLDPVPPKPKAKPVAVKPVIPAKPKNPFDVAATVAGRGGIA
ncbi:MAG: hypothetical protein JWM98_3164 [Thermoleophilia bacterium]|nr:hypothetical protein [Thermoleophilia bacterium]